MLPKMLMNFEGYFNYYRMSVMWLTDDDHKDLTFQYNFFYISVD